MRVTIAPSSELLPNEPRLARHRTLAVAGLAHALHDGYTDLIYVLLPVWQSEFALDYAVLALLRGVYAGLMAALQVPAGRLAERLGGRATLALGTAVAALGYALAGCSGSARRSRSRGPAPAHSTPSPREPCHVPTAAPPVVLWARITSAATSARRHCPL
jgi:MFS family permease